MSLEQDVAAARGAIDALERVCAAVTGHFRDTVDSRRLRVDIARLREDLTLVVGVPPRPVHDPYRASFEAAAYDDGQDFGPDVRADQAWGAPGRRVR